MLLAAQIVCVAHFGPCRYVFIPISSPNPLYISKCFSFFTLFVSASRSFSSILSFTSVLYPPNVFKDSTSSWSPPKSFLIFSTRASHLIPARPIVVFSHTALSAMAAMADNPFSDTIFTLCCHFNFLAWYGGGEFGQRNHYSAIVTAISQRRGWGVSSFHAKGGGRGGRYHWGGGNSSSRTAEHKITVLCRSLTTQISQTTPSRLQKGVRQDGKKNTHENKVLARQDYSGRHRF